MPVKNSYSEGSSMSSVTLNGSTVSWRMSDLPDSIKESIGDGLNSVLESLQTTDKETLSTMLLDMAVRVIRLERELESEVAKRAFYERRLTIMRSDGSGSSRGIGEPSEVNTPPGSNVRRSIPQLFSSPIISSTGVDSDGDSVENRARELFAKYHIDNAASTSYFTNRKMQRSSDQVRFQFLNDFQMSVQSAQSQNVLALLKNSSSSLPPIGNTSQLLMKCIRNFEHSTIKNRSVKANSTSYSS